MGRFGPGRPSPAASGIGLRATAIRLAGLVAAVSRRFVYPFHRTEERARHSRRGVGAAADRLSAICQRPHHLLRSTSLYHEPDWMRPPRGPDVSPYLRWYPVVTFLQLTLDIAMATTSPMGYGHVLCCRTLHRRLDAGGWHSELVAGRHRPAETALYRDAGPTEGDI